MSSFEIGTKIRHKSSGNVYEISKIRENGTWEIIGVSLNGNYATASAVEHDRFVVHVEPPSPFQKDDTVRFTGDEDDADDYKVILVENGFIWVQAPKQRPFCVSPTNAIQSYVLVHRPRPPKRGRVLDL